MSTDKKFCAGCQSFRLITDGSQVIRNRRKRWMCNICQEQKHVSPYASKSTRQKLEVHDANTN